MTTFFHPTLALLAIVLSATVFGAALLHRRLDFEDRFEHLLIATTLGLGAIAQGLFVLGVCGALNRPWTFAALLGAHLLCFRTWRRLAEVGRAAWRGWRWRPRVGWLLAATVILLPSFVLALYPATGFDATVYHLPYVEAFLDADGLVFVPELRFPVFPQVAEMGFVLAFLLEGETTAQLTQWLAMLLVAGLLVCWGRGPRRPDLGWWAAALWLGVPLVVWIAVQAYVDLSLALYVTAALYAWDRWRLKGGGWLMLCGLFAGLAAGTKYLALFLIAVIGLLLLFDAMRRRHLRPLLLWTLAVVVTAGPWYLRILHHTGNPVFPFYSPVFGTSEWTPWHDRSLPPAEAGDRVLEAVAPVVESQLERIGEGLGFLLLLPWNAVFERQIFDLQAPLTPYYLLLLPLCLPFVLMAGRHGRMLFGLLLYALFWLTTVRDLRFLIPALPPLHLALASGLDRLLLRLGRPVRDRRWALFVAALLLLPGWAYAVYKIVDRGPLPATEAEREVYLLEEIPGYAAIQKLDRELGEAYAAYALFGERLQYHADGRLLGDWFGPGNYPDTLAVIDDEEALYRHLRTLEVCELLIVRGPRPLEVPPATAGRPRFELVEAWDDVKLYRLADCQRRNTTQ